jgi:hypothetical protein
MRSAGSGFGIASNRNISPATRSADNFGNSGTAARQAMRASASPAPAPNRASNR